MPKKEVKFEIDLPDDKKFREFGAALLTFLRQWEKTEKANIISRSFPKEQGGEGEEIYRGADGSYLDILPRSWEDAIADAM